jgi:hypothetical protein
MRTRRSVGMLGVLLAVWPANTQASQFEHKQQGREPFQSALVFSATASHLAQ